MFEVWLILLLTALALGLPGLILVLKNMAMTADALSHTILLGIVLAYFVTKDLNSPFLIVSAAFFGLLTIAVIERLSRHKGLREDAATGLVFPLFFSLAVLLISRFGKGAHLDLDNVIMGEVVFTPFNRLELFGLSLPKAAVSMALMLVLNIAFILLFYKELKLMCFDGDFARLSALSPPFLTQAFIFLLSLSAVSAFEVVGAVLVIAFLVIPAASALLLSKRFGRALLLTAALAALYGSLGFAAALKLNVSVPGMCAFIAGLGFFAARLISGNAAPAAYLRRKLRAKALRREAFLFHVYNHEGSEEERYELGFKTIHKHLNWSPGRLAREASRLESKGLLCRDEAEGLWRLSEAGEAFCRRRIAAYGLNFGKD